MQPSCRPKRGPVELTKADEGHYETSAKRDFPAREVPVIDRSRYVRAPIELTKADPDTFVTTTKALHVPLKRESNAGSPRQLTRDTSFTPADPTHFVTTNEVHHGASPAGARSDLRARKSDAAELSPMRNASLNGEFQLAAEGSPNNRRKQTFNTPNAASPRGSVMGALLFGGSGAADSAPASGAVTPNRNSQRTYSIREYPSDAKAATSFSTAHKEHFAPPSPASPDDTAARRARLSASKPAITVDADHFKTTSKSQFTPERAMDVSRVDRSRFVQQVNKVAPTPDQYVTSQKAHFQPWN